MLKQLHQKISSLLEGFSPIIKQSHMISEGRSTITLSVNFDLSFSANSEDRLWNDDPQTMPAIPPKEEQEYSHRGAIHFLNSCDKTVRNMVKDGRLPVIVTSKGKRYKKSALEEAASKLRNNYKKGRIKSPK